MDRSYSLMEQKTSRRWNILVCEMNTCQSEMLTGWCNSDHCVEMLRQTLMCHADTSVTVFVRTEDGLHARDNVTRVCRNFDKLHAWAADHHTKVPVTWTRDLFCISILNKARHLFVEPLCKHIGESWDSVGLESRMTTEVHNFLLVWQFNQLRSYWTQLRDVIDN